VIHKYYPMSAMVKDNRGRYLANTVGTVDEENQRKISISKKHMAQLQERDTKGNV